MKNFLLLGSIVIAGISSISAETIIDASGLALEPKFRSALEGDVDQTLSDISSISKEIGWKPTIKLEDWLKTIITTEEIDEV